MSRPRLYQDGPCYPLTISIPEPLARQIERIARSLGQSPGQFLTPHLRQIVAESDIPATHYEHG